MGQFFSLAVKLVSILRIASSTGGGLFLKFTDLKVDGGASNNNLLMQIQANLLSTNVVRPKTTETTALGVAFLAGLATGFWNDISSIEKLWTQDMSFKPEKDLKTKVIIDLWQKRINRLLKVNE